jgi:hypothetical protein
VVQAQSSILGRRPHPMQLLPRTSRRKIMRSHRKLLMQWPQTRVVPVQIDQTERFRLVPEQLHELTRRTAQLQGCLFRLPRSSSENIQCLGQYGRKIRMLRAYRDLLIPAARPPQLARSIWNFDRPAYAERQLTAALRRFRRDSARRMKQHDRSLDLVAVLPARAGPPGKSYLDLTRKLLRRKCCRMHVSPITVIQFSGPRSAVSRQRLDELHWFQKPPNLQKVFEAQS